MVVHFPTVMLCSMTVVYEELYLCSMIIDREVVCGDDIRRSVWCGRGEHAYSVIVRSSAIIQRIIIITNYTWLCSHYFVMTGLINKSSLFMNHALFTSFKISVGLPPSAHFFIGFHKPWNYTDIWTEILFVEWIESNERKKHKLLFLARHPAVKFDSSKSTQNLLGKNFVCKNSLLITRAWGLKSGWVTGTKFCAINCNNCVRAIFNAAIVERHITFPNNPDRADVWHVQFRIHTIMHNNKVSSNLLTIVGSRYMASSFCAEHPY